MSIPFAPSSIADLAFGKDYKTHSSGHVIEEKNPSRFHIIVL
jgi:hypothetical protein